MGWAKYYEDNLEMFYDRQNARDYSYYSIPTKITIEVVTEQVITVEKTKYKTKNLVCQNCGKTFCFTERDQKFFEQNGWVDPKRCKCCRKSKKVRQTISA